MAEKNALPIKCKIEHANECIQQAEKLQAALNRFNSLEEFTNDQNFP